MKDIDFPDIQPQSSRKGTSVQRFRDSHHRLARVIAMGIRPVERVAQVVGYSNSRVYTMMDDPGFKELVAHYRGDVYVNFKEGQDPFLEALASNMMKAEQMISDKLDEAIENNEPLPTRDLIAISRDAADRTGFGKRQTNVNVNVDFASQLEKAIARSRDPKVVELRAVPVLEQDTSPPASASPLEPPSSEPSSFRRRA